MRFVFDVLLGITAKNWPLWVVFAIVVVVLYAGI